MKKSKLFTLVTIILCLSILHGSTVFASTSSDDYEVNQKIAQIETLLNQYNNEKVTIRIDADRINKENLAFMDDFSEDELNCYIYSLYTDAQNIETTVTNISTESCFSPYIFDQPYTTYTRTAEVSSAIPSIGICNINIRFSSTLSADKYFMDGYVISSHQTGLSIGQWSHSYGEFNIAEYKTYATVRVVGVISYGIPNTPLYVQSEEAFVYIDSYTNY